MVPLPAGVKGEIGEGGSEKRDYRHRRGRRQDGEHRGEQEHDPLREPPADGARDRRDGRLHGEGEPATQHGDEAHRGLAPLLLGDEEDV